MCPPLRPPRHQPLTSRPSLRRPTPPQRNQRAILTRLPRHVTLRQTCRRGPHPQLYQHPLQHSIPARTNRPLAQSLSPSTEEPSFHPTSDQPSCSPSVSPTTT